MASSGTYSLKCPNCGGELKWEAESQLLVCEYCDSNFTEEEVSHLTEGQTPDAEEIAQGEAFSQDTDLYICNSCGAQIFSDHATAATFCYYCHNPVTLTGRLSGEFRPEKVIPFKVARENAVLMFQEHCRKKWFLPGDFTKLSTMEKLTGLYVPFWLADANVEAYADYTATRSHKSRRGDTTHVRVDTFSLTREAQMSYNGVPADGSRKIDDTIMDAIEPFDYRELKDFDISYLAGLYCDKYDVDKAEVLGRIRTRIEAGAVKRLREDIAPMYETVTEKNHRIRMLGVRWHYMMMPVWFFTYKYAGKVYEFAMNAQTGKVAGQYPVSKLKMLMWSAALFAAVGLVITLIAGFLGG
ncbi:MAG: hypothetical protein II714_04415 [Oscillospiraceae bacterium]|nr:hypothetical protein [Oscillospiraceae bacterium]